MKREIRVPRPVSAGSPNRVVAVSIAMLASTLWLTGAHAGPPRPPGGPHPLHRGGDNLSGYPPLTFTAVGDSIPGSLGARLIVLAHPNPARGDARFRLQVTRGERVRVRLYSVAGRLVREWLRDAPTTGWTEWRWDGRDHRGEKVGAGLYFFRAEAGAQRATGRLVMLR